MARLRPIQAVNVLAAEEKTRLTNFFMLLVEIDARLPKTKQAKRKKRALQKIKQKPIIKYINDKKIPPCSSLRTAWRDLLFNRLLLNRYANPSNLSKTLTLMLRHDLLTTSITRFC